MKLFIWPETSRRALCENEIYSIITNHLNFVILIFHNTCIPSRKRDAKPKSIDYRGPVHSAL